MKRSVVLFGVLILVVSGATVLADVCPLCLRNTPERVKYCEQHQAEIIAKRTSSLDEGRLADAVARSRSDYRAKLEALREYYVKIGDAGKLRRIEAELGDFRSSRKFAYVHWEDTLPELSATKPNQAADNLLTVADKQRKSLNPFNRAKRFKSAARQYSSILTTHPDSTAVEHAAFGLGKLYGSNAVGEYRRAVTFFRLSYRSNPKTARDSMFQAAQLLDNQLADYEPAAQHYWIAAKTTRSGLTYKRAVMRLKSLQTAGFGLAYKIEGAARPKKGEGEPAAEPPAK